MNATPPSLNPGNAVQAQAQSGRPTDPAAADTPFSQVLSGEIARQGGDTREDADLRDSAATAGSETVQQLLAGAALPNEAAADLVLLASGEVAPQAPNTADASTGTPTPPPEAMLALGMLPELAKPAPAAAPDTPADPTDALAVALDTRGGRPGIAPQSDAAAETSKARPGQAALGQSTQIGVATAPGSESTSESVSTAAAAAFSEKLAAARQSDPARAGERVAELMNHPGMRAAVHAAAAEAVPFAADPAASRLAPAVGTPAWGQALGDKLVWMASGAQQTASLTLNPPNLGPLQVVLDVKNDQATASFYAAQPEVRQALESALPRLREMMTEAGIQLGQATVSADTPRQNDSQEHQAQRLASERAGADSSGLATPSGLAVPVARAGRGLVDTFA